jgi:hypothetical protein
MTTMRTFLILILILFSNQSLLFGQKELSIKEILFYFSQSEKKTLSDNDSTIDIGFNIDLKNIVIHIVDSLSSRNIDSIILFSISPRGLYAMNQKDICVNTHSPITVYIFWKRKGQLIIKKIKNGCDKGIEKINSTIIFDYYSDNQKEIRNEVIMPIIKSAVIVEDSVMTYSGGGLYDGQNRYSINDDSAFKTQIRKQQNIF